MRLPANSVEQVSSPSVTKRASAYLAKREPSVSRQGGHSRLFAAARDLVWGFCLTHDEAYHLLAEEFNPRCRPEWSEKELRHKVEDAQQPEEGAAAPAAPKGA